MTEETKRKISKANKGRKITWADKISKALTGRKLSDKQRKSLEPVWEARRGIKRPKEIGEKIRNAQIGKPRLNIRGEKHYLWKGNQDINRKIRDCWKYQEWRSDIFQRDNWTCQTCRKRGCYLEVHHIKEMSVIIEENKIKTLKQALNCDELWSLNNGVTLCRNCHDLTKKGKIKVCGNA